MIGRLAAHASRRRFLKGSLAVAVSAPMLPRLARAQQRQVNVYNWDTYIGPNTLDNFSAATGIDVRYDLYADNSELFARFREGNPGYDVIFPTNDYAERMILAQIIRPLDKALIPNFSNLMPRFQDSAYDPDRMHTVPYFWGTVGLGYRRSALAGSPQTWGIIYDQSAPHAGRISWLSEASDVIHPALKYLGYSLNTTDEAAIEEAIQLLIRSKDNIRSIAGDNGQDLLLSGEVDLALEYNGDVLQVMEEDDDLSFAVPAEGTVLWEDVMAIPKDAPHQGEAHEFINFILEPEVHAAIAEYVYYPLPNAAAKELMSEAYLTNPAIFPPDEVVERSEVALYLGEDIIRLINEGMTRVRAA
jgi:spermidine/putrescine transport system substrate-binding protein